MTVKFSFHSVFILPLTKRQSPPAQHLQALQFNTNRDSITAAHVADMIIAHIMQRMKSWLISWDH